eukprot:6209184-Pleurochrysis_carterae.AAC.4
MHAHASCVPKFARTRAQACACEQLHVPAKPGACKRVHASMCMQFAAQGRRNGDWSHVSTDADRLNLDVVCWKLRRALDIKPARTQGGPFSIVCLQAIRAHACMPLRAGARARTIYNRIDRWLASL